MERDQLTMEKKQQQPHTKTRWTMNKRMRINLQYNQILLNSTARTKEMKGQKANMLLKDTALNQNPDLDSDTLEIQPMLTV